MKNISIFQLVFLGIFVLAIGAGVIATVLYSSSGQRRNEVVPIGVWGTLDSSVARSVVEQIQQNNKNLRITYTQKSEKTFDTDLTQAIATGVGPDIIILRHDSLVSNLSLIAPISYESYLARDYRDNFIQESELFLTPKGILALPFVVDPLVMYWNRDLFFRNGLSDPPRYWDEVFSVAQRLTKRDVSGAIVQSSVALGEFGNVAHAKEILSAMLIQSGNNITEWNKDYTSANVTLSGDSSLSSPANVLSFFMQFSDPRKSVYSWNRAVTDSRSMFLSNRLALYFGFASEVKDLKEKSPNLNFDVAFLPQSRNSSVSGTFGRLYGLAILRSSTHQSEALSVVKALVSKRLLAGLNSQLYLPSVQKAVKAPSSDPIQTIFQKSALVSFGWLDPDREVSDLAFKEMINSVESGFISPAQAIGEAARRLQYASRK